MRAKEYITLICVSGFSHTQLIFEQRLTLGKVLFNFLIWGWGKLSAEVIEEGDLIQLCLPDQRLVEIHIREPTTHDRPLLKPALPLNREQPPRPHRTKDFDGIRDMEECVYG